MGKAILTVSYGTLQAEEMQRSVLPVIEAVEASFPGRACYRAFASEVYLSSLRRMGKTALGCAEAVEKIASDGYDMAGVAALFIAPGTVYGSVVKAASGLRVSEPLLDGPEDFETIAVLYGDIARSAGRKVLLMGHGNETEGDACYRRLAEALPENVRLACRTGEMQLDGVLNELDARRDRILLMPLMLTAGSHARRDLAGDGPDSWKSILESRNFDVQVRLEGMGSLPAIQAMFVKKAKAAIGDG